MDVLASKQLNDAMAFSNHELLNASKGENGLPEGRATAIAMKG